MAKPIPYNALPIPRVGATFEEINPQAEIVRKLDQPGIIIPAVGPDVPTAMGIVSPILADCGITIHRKEPMIMNVGGTRDQPLHIDAIPADHPSTGMVVQFTQIGSADVLFTKLADPFCEELIRRNSHIPVENAQDVDYSLPPGTEELIVEGLIDPDILSPEVFVGSVAAGDVIAFTFTGVNPIAHRFETTSPQRLIQTHLASFTRIELDDTQQHIEDYTPANQYP